jgi:hypothetical protein
MNLEAIATHLAANDCGTVGTTIFVTEMPSETTEGILLMGPYSGAPVDKNLPDFYKTEFRLVVRSTSYTSGRALAKKASGVLNNDAGFSVFGMLVKQIYPQNLPRPYRRSVAGYWEFEVDVSIAYYEQNA